MAQRKTGAPTYRELMRFSAFREWVSQRSVRASSSALSCSHVSLLGAPIKPMDKANKSHRCCHFKGLGGVGLGKVSLGFRSDDTQGQLQSSDLNFILRLTGSVNGVE